MVNVEKEMARQMNAEEPYRESSDESMMMDSQQNNQQGLRLPSNVTPEDFYQYKKFINSPESQAEFVTKIDKDVVFANIGGVKPTREELRFQVGTLELAEGEWIYQRLIPRKDEFGNFVRDSENNIIMDVELVFDEYFRSCFNFLKGQYKFDLVSSRAMGGQDRAAFLDISSNNRISKEFSRKKDNQSKFFGTGGM